MPNVLTGSFLDANLAILGELNADFADRLRQAAPSPELTWETAADGCDVPTLGGRPLCSRHRPTDEAKRLLEKVDVVEHAVIVCMGFGAGHHVEHLARRIGKAGLIIVFEPDLGLLRAVFERIDLRPWLSNALVLWFTDPSDSVAMARKLHNAESIVAQGVHILEHPPSRPRLGDDATRFTTMLSDYVTTSKTTLLTTLIRSVDTTRNLLLNLPRYAGGDGIAELAGAAAGHPAVVVSAGPSLRRNIDRLAATGVRDRCVIVATQTTLKPLLAAGVRPHFVTALDYHEISRRFYEGLTAEDVADTTLVADPKGNPVILDVFPGAVRCCASSYVDDLLGPLKRDMGTLTAGATVAHLAYYLARYLGCDPVMLIGQDLGFTDGFYYARGTAIDDVWSSELNPFNTIEMMEWQRIARHKLLLAKVDDIHGHEIYTDRQMLVYLQQFERDFAADAEKGLTTIDATEGGARKQHAEPMPLDEALARWANRRLPALPQPGHDRDEARRVAVARRLDDFATEVAELRDAAVATADLLRRAQSDAHDAARVSGLMDEIEAQRRIVTERMNTFGLLDRMNQMGCFKRLRADRKLHLQTTLDEGARQAAQLERDLDNVTWTADAAVEMLDLLDAAQRRLAGELADAPAETTAVASPTPECGPGRIAAMVPIDPERNALGVARSLADRLGDSSVLQRTLERIGRAKGVDEIVLIAPEGFDVEPLLQRAAIGIPVDIERCAGSPFGPAQPAIAAARLWADTSWRGGIAGMSVFDEALCPELMLPILQRRGLTAVLPVAPDWPFVDPALIESIVARHGEHPDELPLVFTQAPPGLGGCLVGEPLMADLTTGNRLARLGPLLVYQPHAPQHDPIARDTNVQIDHRLRGALVRATWDAPRHRAALTEAFDALGADARAEDVAEALRRIAPAQTDFGPQHVIMELTTDRQAGGPLREQEPFGDPRPPMELALARRILGQLDTGDVVLTLGGFGDPLLHPQFDQIATLAKDHGVRAVHVRTELLVAPEVIDRLVASGVDVVSVELHADRAATYERMTGADRFRDVLESIQVLADARDRLTAHEDGGAFCRPWIVPRLQRCPHTRDDIEPFFDRWQAILGAAVIEGPPPREDEPELLASGRAPASVSLHEARRRMLVLSDGRVPVSELDAAGADSIGSAADETIARLWSRLRERRERVAAEHGPGAEPLRMFRP